MARTIAGVLFDKDGTLFDFAATWRAVTEAVLDRLAPSPAARAEMALLAGFDPVSGRFAAGSAIVAGATSDVALLWEPFRPDLGAAGIEAAANAVAAEAARRPDWLVPAADLPAVLGRLRDAGLALGVATNDSAASAHAQLAAAGAAGHFSFVAGYDSGYDPKPAPAMLHAFAAAAGIAPGAVAVVGDSRHDLEMARAGGAALAIGVLTGPATRAELAPLAHHVIASVAALPALLDPDGGWCHGRDIG